MRIFHIATLPDWETAQRTGRYTTSTRGRTLAEEGFIHASRGDQWQGVRERFYSDVEESLVLLSIDTDLLTAPVVEEPVADSAETFPHIYGAIEVAAVTAVLPLSPIRSEPLSSEPLTSPLTPGPAAKVPLEPSPPVEPGPSFSSLFLGEMFHNMMLACVVMAVVAAGALAGVASDTEWGPIGGAAVGLVAGVALARAVHRRRD